MAREKEYFRDVLEQIRDAFPGKEMLNIKEVASFVGCDHRTAKKMFSFTKHNRISIVVLAREMC